MLQHALVYFHWELQSQGGVHPQRITPTLTLLTLQCAQGHPRCSSFLFLCGLGHHMQMKPQHDPGTVPVFTTERCPSVQEHEGPLIWRW